MAMEKNKVKFGLNKVHYAKILSYDEEGMPVYDTPVRLPGAVSLSIDASGENEPFYADNCVYYMCSNNSGYEGELEIALVTTDFATEILGQKLDSKSILVESNDAEVAEFALFFEFEGDRHKIRHVMYRCSVARPATESATTEDSKEVKTETLSLTASALENGLVKSKSCEETDETVYNNWYKAVYMPDFAATAVQTAKSTSTATAAKTTS